MCGFCGFISHTAEFSNKINIIDCLQSMNNQLIHRGPDDAGYWVKKENGIALAHRRLAIVDLSTAGHQPMESSNQRYVIAFNGEIYNFQSLREKLNKTSTTTPHWRGHSDTEVILALIESCGLKSTLKQLVGMFAFALWDKQKKTLTLARDRMGEKPLYYGWQNSTFFFGSELKAFKPHPHWEGIIDRNALASYMRHNAVPAPYSIYQGIKKLSPGQWLTISKDDRIQKNYPVPQTYWSIEQVSKEAKSNPFTGTKEQAVEELDQLLRQSIEDQMLADVPLGAFLSGGVDSSTVVALMQDLSDQPVNTFSIGFHEDKYNEAHYAKDVAKHLKTQHTELYVTSQQARDVIPQLPHLYDEPFADSSQIPTYLVSVLARNKVTVSLSGDGGDELFCGYTRYQRGLDLWNKISRIPARKTLASIIRNLPSQTVDMPLLWADSLLTGAESPGSISLKLNLMADLIGSNNPVDVYSFMQSLWKQPEDVVFNADEPKTLFNQSDHLNTHFQPEIRDAFMYIDQHTYLPDDILTKVDRAAMGVSLETRVPLLDHRIVDFSWRLPTEIKTYNNQQKWPLRQVLYQYVPASMIERPKMGFGIPIGDWLRGELRPWAEELLEPQRLERESFFRPELIQKMWHEHLTRHRDWHHQLWVVLMFQQWLEAQ